MKKPVVVLVVGVLILAALWNFSKSQTTTAETLKIGAALPLTGAVASFGEEFRRGAEVAQEEINKNGELVKVVFEDTALQTNLAVNAVNKLVNVDNVNAVFVSAYSEAAVTRAITDKKDIPMLVLWDSNPELEAMGERVFALGPWTPASGEVTAEFVYKNNLRRAAIFGYNQEWSKAVSAAFEGGLKKMGGVVTHSEFSNPGATDYRTQLSKIVKSNPDVVYITTEDFLKAVKQIKDLGYKGKIITSDLLDNAQIEQDPLLFDGIYGSQVADPANQETSHYMELYKKKFGENPKKVLYGTWGYDAVHLFYKAHSDYLGKSIVEALYKVDYSGASGEVKFDKNGTSKTIPKMFVVTEGKIIEIKQ